MVKRVICRERQGISPANADAQKQLALATVNLLFEKFHFVDIKPEAARSYFALLCKYVFNVALAIRDLLSVWIF